MYRSPVPDTPTPATGRMLEWAVSEQRILITIDTDFGKLLFVDRAAHCGLVRLPDVRADERIALMEVVVSGYGRELAAGAIITVRGNKIRVSRWPE